MSKETGFPSPAQGYDAKNIDLNNVIIKNPEATYFMRADSDKMIGKGVLNKSILVVDRSRTPKIGDLVVASFDGSFICREYVEENQKKGLFDGENSIFPKDELTIFGTVITVINQFY